MRIFIILSGMMWAGFFGSSVALFAHQGNWAMVTFISGLIFAIFNLVAWILDLRE